MSFKLGSSNFSENLLQITGSFRNEEISLYGLDGLEAFEKNAFRLVFDGKGQVIARRRWFVSKGTVALQYMRQLELSFFFRCHSARM